MNYLLKSFRDPSYSLDLNASDYWLFASMKNMRRRKKLGSNEEASAEMKALTASKS